MDDPMTDVENELTIEMDGKNHAENVNSDNGEDESMNTAYPPEGVGQFRDPVDVLSEYSVSADRKSKRQKSIKYLL